MSAAEDLAVIVCGGRDFDAPAFVARALDGFDARYPIAVVFEGEARGVDRAARAWAEARNRQVRPMPADWAAHMDRAGPIRNARMLEALLEYSRRAVIAFPGGKGTEDMTRKAHAAGVTVFRMSFAWTTADAPVKRDDAPEFPLAEATR